MKTKVALVTGSNKGIGKAIADRLERSGMVVVRNGLSVNPDPERGLGTSLGPYIRGDVGTEWGRRRIAGHILTEYGQLDVLVNNAAHTELIEHSNLPELTEERFDRMYEVNLKGPFLLTTRLHSSLIQSDSPNIINIASVAGTTGNGSNIAYCALKAGLINMTKSLARSLAPIRVNAISPGLIDTTFVDWSEEDISDIVSKTPVNRIGDPEDIADAVMSVLDMEYLTGQNITVDGGRTLN
jgi:3-oxoacyl-[acyl-carrier protein] reductase